MPKQPDGYDYDELLKLFSRAAEEDTKAIEVDLETVREEQNSLEFQKLQYELEQIEQKLSQAAQIHSTRLSGLKALFGLVVGWLAVICLFVGASGWIENPLIKLSDPVLIALISSTTVSVLGLFLVAAKWLYGNHDSRQPTRKDKKPKKRMVPKAGL